MAGRTIIVTVLLALTVTACWDKEEQQHDVLYYCSNDAAREAKLKECRNDPGRLGITPNCINASKAWSLNKDGCAGIRR